MRERSDEPPAPYVGALDEAEKAGLTTCRRKLHRRPELAMEEHETAAYVEADLRAMGLEPVRCAETGLVATLGRGEVTRCVMLRADMDALPVQEASGEPFASEKPGLMHACGHDAHMAILLAVTRRLVAHSEAIAGTVKVVFQPAEERGQGAPRMIAGGVLAAPHVDAALGLHMWSPLPTGEIGLYSGAAMAAVGEFELTVIGSGGHGALPHTAHDPVVAAAQIVMALQTIPSRLTDPMEPVVVTVGAIHGGTGFNVIADRVELLGTVRCFGAEVAARFPALLEEVAGAVAATQGARVEVEWSWRTIALRNDAAMCDLVVAAARATPGVHRIDTGLRMMAGEDMAYFLAERPGVYFFVGCGGAEGGAPHHSPRFRVDEAALPIGAEVLLRAVAGYFGRPVA